MSWVTEIFLMLLTTGAKTRELLGSGIFHVRFSVHIGLWVKPQRGKQWTRRAAMHAKFDTPGPFSLTFCLTRQTLLGQHGVVKNPAPNPPCPPTLFPDMCGETQAGIQAPGVCSLGP